MKWNISVSRNKSDKSDKGEETEELTFPQKTEIVVHSVERVAFKLFVGVCVYVLLDTYRQCSIEGMKYPEFEDVT